MVTNRKSSDQSPPCYQAKYLYVNVCKEADEIMYLTYKSLQDCCFTTYTCDLLIIIQVNETSI
jgi:hypothetical protein